MSLSKLSKLAIILCLTITWVSSLQAADAIGQGQDQAQAAYDQGIEYFKAGKYAEAAAAFEEAIRLDPSKPEAYRQLGDSYHILEKDDQAIKAYQQMIILNPEDAKAYRRLGDLYSGLGQFKEAIDLYQQAFGLDPNDETREALAQLIKNELYDRFRKNYKTNQPAAYEAGKEYLQKYRDDEPEQHSNAMVLKYIESYIAAYERALNSQKP